MLENPGQLQRLPTERYAVEQSFARTAGIVTRVPISPPADPPPAQRIGGRVARHVLSPPRGRTWNDGEPELTLLIHAV